MEKADIWADVLLDEADRARVEQYQWRRDPKGYIVRKGDGEGLHRFLVGAVPGEVVHHRNRNHLDNRQSNLAKLTREQHSQEHAADRAAAWKAIAAHRREMKQRRLAVLAAAKT